jgi:TonB family protein
MMPLGQAEDLFDEPIETLETIEIPATVILQEERDILIPFPTMKDLTPLPTEYQIRRDPVRQNNNMVNVIKTVRDPIADMKGKRKPVRPTKAEHPPYPQFARAQGWEGTVVLRIKINQSGAVDSVRTRKSSGFPILDESAIHSVKTWRFEPAKDGEFPIPVTVDLPIRFDLDAQ